MPFEAQVDGAEGASPPKISGLRSPAIRDSPQLSTQIKEFAVKNGLKYYFTSAKNGKGIKDGFIHIAKEEALNFDEDEE